MSVVEKLFSRFVSILYAKEDAEASFWRKEILRYEEWLSGALLYKTPSPTPSEIIPAQNTRDSAILTWHKVHQEKKYLSVLELPEDAFAGMKILDVGAGPMPSATCFMNCEVYCLEPLLDRYLAIGFPLHYYPSARFIHAQSEDIPVTDHFFDAVISVNAIDHVNDFAKTAVELKRVLKPRGLFRMHVHYHPPTYCEPIELNDAIFSNAYSWCEGLEKLSQSQESFSATLEGHESFALWSNFRRGGG